MKLSHLHVFVLHFVLQCELVFGVKAVLVKIRGKFNQVVLKVTITVWCVKLGFRFSGVQTLCVFSYHRPFMMCW